MIKPDIDLLLCACGAWCFATDLFFPKKPLLTPKKMVEDTVLHASL